MWFHKLISPASWQVRIEARHQAVPFYRSTQSYSSSWRSSYLRKSFQFLGGQFRPESYGDKSWALIYHRPATVGRTPSTSGYSATGSYDGSFSTNRPFTLNGSPSTDGSSPGGSATGPIANRIYSLDGKESSSRCGAYLPEVVGQEPANFQFPPDGEAGMYVQGVGFTSHKARPGLWHPS